MSALTQFLIQEAAAINSAASNLNPSEVEKSLKLLNNCYSNRGKLIISGVGKSGIVARKISATFSSIGLTAINLNPLDALHGDLGIISERDVCIFLSNSGETLELLNIVPHIKKRNIPIISIVGNVESTLANESFAILNSAVEKEICPLNLAPTASTSVAMAIGDAMAAECINRSGISTNDFAFNHPAGSLGKQLTLTARDLMIPIKKIKPLNKDSNLQKIISTLTNDGMGVSWVEKSEFKGALAGLITDGDLRRVLDKTDSKKWSKIKAEDMMTKNPITINQEYLAIDSLKLMEENEKKQITTLPVVEENRGEIYLKGILRMHDLIKAGLK